jgi:glucose/arabinose dehydrogenase
MRRQIAAGLTLILCALATPVYGQLRAEQVVTGLSQPVAFVQDPSDATVQLIVQQNGRIRVLKSGTMQTNDFLDLRGVVLNSGEQGLLGLAFAPNYASSGRVFVNFVNTSGNTVIARFNRSASDPLRAEAGSRFDFLWPSGQRFIAQPFSNHKGGNLAFGPDGFLYIGMGDGGSGNDPMHLAQNPLSLLGKMLRLDVAVPDNDPEGYNIPSGNPFVGRAGVLPEIWSVGLRNPWRWSFDDPGRGGTGALVMGDVGQAAWEEVDYEPAGQGGRNYGWRNREGAHDNVTSLAPFSTPLTDPIFEYPRSVGGSITGGFVYRGSALGVSYRGRYFFADFVSSRVWSLALVSNASGASAGDLREHTAELGAVATQSPSSFGVDANGELYLVSYAGSVHRIGSTAPPPPASYPRKRPSTSAPTGVAVPRSAAGAAPASAATRRDRSDVTSETAQETAAPRLTERSRTRVTAMPRFQLITDEAGRAWLVAWSGKGWLMVDPSDESAVRLLLCYVLAGSMSTEIFRHRP